MKRSPNASNGSHEAAIAFLARLRLDHARLSRVMREIEVQRARLQSAPDSAKPVLADAIGYLVDYQHAVHHPREDLLFGKIAARSPPMRTELRGLSREHEAGLLHAERLRRRLPGMSAGQLRGAKGRRFARELQAYVDETREHMRREERSVFYAGVEPMLDATDWQALQGATVPEDPLGDPAVLARRYPHLAAEIGETVRGLSSGTRARAMVGAHRADGQEPIAAAEALNALVESYAELLHDGFSLLRTNVSAVLGAGSPLAAARALPDVGRRSMEYATRCLLHPARTMLDVSGRIVRSAAPTGSPDRRVRSRS